MNLRKHLLTAALASACIIAAVSLTSCSNTTDTATQSPGSSAKAKVYTCEMHPDVVSDKPGKCPKCGMNLVEKK